MTKKNLLTAVLATIHLVAYVFIFLLHRGLRDTTGIEGIKELQFWILLPPVLLFVASFIKSKITTPVLHFLGLLSLSILIYVMSAHTGVRSSVSLFDRPEYLVGVISGSAILAIIFGNQEHPGRS